MLVTAVLLAYITQYNNEKKQIEKSRVRVVYTYFKSKIDVIFKMFWNISVESV